MTAKAQRIAIAEACGWQLTDAKTWINHKTGIQALFFNQLPDYLNDLNAMHKAEKVLTKDLWPKFISLLSRSIQMPIGTGTIRWQQYQSLLRATAYQRAEAFLRVLNLYTT